jgi:alkylresorcinol/alkylpyrone synthase
MTLDERVRIESVRVAAGPRPSGPAIWAMATGLPGQRYSQAEVFDYLQGLFKRARPARAVFTHSDVDWRHMVADREFYQQAQGTAARNERYLLHALPLGAATIRRCLEAAGLGPEAVDDFFVVSCTGFDIPGLDLRLAGALGMRADLRRTCVLGMGCYGAFPALQRAREAVSAAGVGRLALVLALELCSLHLQMDDSLENMVVSALFADGAAAVLVGDGPRPQAPVARLAHAPAAAEAAPAGPITFGTFGGPRLVDAQTHCDYTTFDHMAFHVTDHGFQMRLSAYVPQLLAASIRPFVAGLLERNGLRRADVRFWGIHPGGRKILDYLQKELSLSDADLAHSRGVLRHYGNMSSPTILFVLEAIQRQGAPQPGDYGVLMAFGPGLTLESMLVQW